MTALGPIGRLGRWAAAHARAVFVAWAAIALVFGFFAPRVETALSGAGWEATGSESVFARTLVDQNFRGLSSSGLMVVVHAPGQTVRDPAFRAAIARSERILRRSDAVTVVVPPQPGRSISRDGRTAVIQAGAARGSNDMVRAAEREFLVKHERDGIQLAVLEIPLLFETGGDRLVDAVAVVSAAPEKQRERLLLRPGMTAEKLDGLLKRQTNDAEKRARADFVVDTNGTIAETEAAVARIAASLRGRRGEAFSRHWAGR